MTDWSEHTIQLKKLSSERDAALNDKNMKQALKLQEEINNVDLDLMIWIIESYK